MDRDKVVVGVIDGEGVLLRDTVFVDVGEKVAVGVAVPVREPVA